mmetsp:Transcript_13167/g.20472  ORF Transcript_13167/g.20472 Transcript_13167/m.20472 type:complete len:266 (+) Transcript_13167:231-1028(+)
MKLSKVPHLVLIEEASVVGSMLKGVVYRVEKLLFVPLGSDASLTSASEDLPFIEMIQKVQAEKSFYFSYDIDMTQNLQATFSRIENTQQPANDNLAYMRTTFPNSVDYIPYFAVNHEMLHEFRGIEYSPFRVPCIFGYVFISQPEFKHGAKTDFYLVSRKDCRRPGRRFITRGLDDEGNAANFVETEHIFVQYMPSQEINVSSYVQIRGSIPLLWSMKPNMKWSPPVIINPNLQESLQVAKKHFSSTKTTYGSQYLVNLIDKKGS